MKKIDIFLLSTYACLKDFTRATEMEMVMADNGLIKARTRCPFYPFCPVAVPVPVAVAVIKP